MKLGKKFWWLAGCAFAALLLAVLFFVGRSEPVYEGRNFSSWFHEAEMMPNVISDAPATKAIRAMGSNAVPFLAARVRHDDPSWLRAYNRRYPGMSPRFRRWLPEPRPPGARPENAARLLFEIGPDASAAVPDLIGAYDRAYLKFYQMPPRTKLNWMTQFTNPPLVTATTNLPSENRLRVWVVVALGLFGDENKETIPLLFAATHDWNGTVRGQALYQLRYSRNLTNSIAMAEPIIFAALQDKDAVIRALAANVLGRIASTHADVVVPLLQAAEDSDAEVRREALKSLQKAQLDLRFALPVLGRIISDPASDGRGFAVRALTKSAGLTNIIPTLNKFLGDADPHLRLGAAQALVFYGTNAQIAIPNLQQLRNPANEPDESIRRAAAAALEKIASQ